MHTNVLGAAVEYTLLEITVPLDRLRDIDANPLTGDVSRVGNALEVELRACPCCRGKSHPSTV
jgi:hypothetical protein